jgi:tetratricopeptide (TPR) repeat protein
MASGFRFFVGPSRQYGAFRWRLDEDAHKTAMRDLTWDFAEPDQYPELVARQKPGFMASKGEKAFHDAVSTADPDEMLRVAGQNPKYIAAANVISGLLTLEMSLHRGMELLQTALGAGDIGKDHFVHKYLPEAGLSVVIAEGLMVRLPLQRNAIVLLLAELFQAEGRAGEALALLDGAEPTTHIQLSKTELLYQDGRYDDVVAATEGVVNDDDFTALRLAYRGRALAELGRADEAVSVFARVLEYPNRAPSVKVLALVGRGMINQARGELILAENDFTRALIEIPDDAEARRHVEALMRHQGEQGG